MCIAGAAAQLNACFPLKQTSVWVMFGCVGLQLSAECGLILQRPLKYTCHSACFIKDEHRGQFSAASPCRFPVFSLFRECPKGFGKRLL